MNKKLGVALALCLLLVGGNAFAELNTHDVVPAATLLLPYFEVDFANPNPLVAVTTLFSINNASAAATIAHVTLWTDWSVPTIDFDVYLTGYDVQSINVRDIFASGNLPVTADRPRDPLDTISPQAIGPTYPNTTWDPVAGIANCGSNLPFTNPAVAGALLTFIRLAHTGQLVPGPAPLTVGCYGVNHGDNIARGYITVDDANQCSLQFPGDPGYFVNGGIGTASNDNQLFGDYFLVDPAEDFAQGDQLVHIEAGPPFPFTPFADAYVAGDYTFYGRYNAFGGTDDREPLATTWGVRYLQGGVFNGTDLTVWRDTARIQSASIAACSTPPVPFPLNQQQVVAFSETEDAVRLCVTPGGNISPDLGGQLQCFPWETQRVSVGVPPLNPPFSFGWLYLNLNTSTGVPAVDPIKQSFVAQLHFADGRFSVGYQGVQFDNASDWIAGGPAGAVVVGFSNTGAPLF